MGTPVFVSQKRWDDLKLTRTFNCQQLLDPSPLADMKLNPDFLLPIERRMIPKNLYRFLIGRPGRRSRDEQGAVRANVGFLGVWRGRCRAPFTDDIGQSRVFIEDLSSRRCPESEAIRANRRMYLKAGMVMKVGVEKVGISSTHIHVSKALQAAGPDVSFDPGGNGVLLRPAGRNKKKFIEGALSWPLNNEENLLLHGLSREFHRAIQDGNAQFPGVATTGSTCSHTCTTF